MPLFGMLQILLIAFNYGDQALRTFADGSERFP